MTHNALQVLAEHCRLKLSIEILMVEDNRQLRPAMKNGEQSTGEMRVAHNCGAGEDALVYGLHQAEKRDSKRAKKLAEKIEVEIDA